MKYSAIIFFALLIISGCKNHNPDNYFSASSVDSLLMKLAVYTENKPEGVSYEDRFKSEYSVYYKNLITVQNMKLDRLYRKDSLWYFTIVKRDIKSLYDDKRATGGVFRLNGDSVCYMDIMFVTPQLKEEDLSEKVNDLFAAMTENEMQKYTNDVAYIEWPNRDVLYSSETNRWYFPEGSKYKIFEEVMTGKN